ncbi:Uncharacterized protein conserved in bacteria [Morganella morganii]|uniref:DUF2213 domain-containing protein n=1 Tax=Morganella morganii TaxID=582 RepID=UPI000D8F9A45|nr:DUF2213 domain-containing protein [Morganella morganii]SPX94013.1 Uncharacterized protein conserved in bacteria [Morganella morganii]
MTMTDRLAFDRSMRSKDGNGHLIVERTVLSKAAVNPYRGKEIPGFESLGLDPEKVYYLLRDPAELERAAKTFSKKQLLIRHVPVDSDEPQKEDTIGTIGSDITFESGMLYGDLCVWDGYAIDLIESGKMKELSAGYGYTPDMTSGEYEGQHYDGVMRNIFGNHVALVERGRIGRDAIISDHQTVDLETEMKLKKGALPEVAAQIKKALGMDADIPENQLHAILTAVKLGMDVSPEDLVGAKDEDDGKKADAERKKLEETDRDDRDAKAEDEDDKKSEDEDDKKAEDEDDKDTKKAMDAALSATKNDTIKQMTAMFSAARDVEPLVGVIVMDGFTSADDVYKYALKQKGIACDGVTGVGLASMVKMAKDTASTAKPKVAMDAGAFADEPLVSRFKQA